MLSPPATVSDPDIALLDRFHRGDREAASRLYERYADRVLRLARGRMSRALAVRLDPDDIAQSVFRHFFEAARTQQYHLPTGQELWDLLLVITLNRVRSLERYHRQGKRDLRQTVACDTVLELAIKDGPPMNVMIDNAISTLPADLQPLVWLRLEGHDVAEIADRAGMSKRTVERLLQRTRARLRTLFESEAVHDCA